MKNTIMVNAEYKDENHLQEQKEQIVKQVFHHYFNVMRDEFKVEFIAEDGKLTCIFRY